jgi:ThiF family protein
MNEDQFEELFDSRTVLYEERYRADTRPTIVSLGGDVHSVPGHALAMALCNQLARVHRHVVLVGDLDVPLLCRDAFGAATLMEATAGLITLIRPSVEVDVVARIPKSEGLVSIALGRSMGAADITVGCEGWVAEFGRRASIASDPTGVWGAGLAACLTANFAFQRILGAPAAPCGRISLWDRARPGGGQGPGGTVVDVGRALQVGAGAVGSALDFWLALLGLAGAWTIVDKDLVDATNLNRQLLFLAADAGLGGGARNKAKVAADRLGPVATAVEGWYGEDSGVVDATYDIALALANDHGARELLQGRNQPVLLHATTSRNWQAQLHRHIAGRDDCISCRIPGEVATTGCAGAPVRPHQPDAALPFLSGLAGLLVAQELRRLEVGLVSDESANLHAVSMRRANPVGQHLMLPCRTGCRTWAPTEARRELWGETRFAYLDPAHQR